MAELTLVRQYQHHRHNLRAVAALLMLGFTWHMSMMLAAKRGTTPVSEWQWLMFFLSGTWSILGVYLWSWRPWAHTLASVLVPAGMGLSLFLYYQQTLQGHPPVSHMIEIVLGLYCLYLLFHPISRRLLQHQGNIERAMLHVAA